MQNGYRIAELGRVLALRFFFPPVRIQTREGPAQQLVTRAGVRRPRVACTTRRGSGPARWRREAARTAAAPALWRDRRPDTLESVLSPTKNQQRARKTKRITGGRVIHREPSWAVSEESRGRASPTPAVYDGCRSDSECGRPDWRSGASEPGTWTLHTRVSGPGAGLGRARAGLVARRNGAPVARPCMQQWRSPATVLPLMHEEVWSVPPAADGAVVVPMRPRAEDRRTREPRTGERPCLGARGENRVAAPHVEKATRTHRIDNHGPSKRRAWLAFPSCTRPKKIYNGRAAPSTPRGSPGSDVAP